MFSSVVKFLNFVRHLKITIFALESIVLHMIFYVDERNSSEVQFIGRYFGKTSLYLLQDLWSCWEPWLSALLNSCLRVCPASCPN